MHISNNCILITLSGWLLNFSIILINFSEVSYIFLFTIIYKTKNHAIKESPYIIRKLKKLKKIIYKISALT